jgi:hypothetical protein
MNPTVHPDGEASAQDVPSAAPMPERLRARVAGIPRLYALIAAAVLVLGIAAAAIVPTWDDPGDPLDEGLLLAEPELLQEGTFPYRDYESLYGPANTVVLAGVYALTSPDVSAERAVGLAYRLGTVAGVFVIAAAGGLVRMHSRPSS